MTEFSDIAISHESTVPLHLQLRRELHRLIESGRYLPGSRLPSELQLQRDLNISRNTIRQALREVEHDGLIERIPGKGTFVALPSPPPEVDQRMIAFVTCDFDSEFERRLLHGAESAARAQGFQVIFYNIRREFAEENRLLDELARNHVGGVVLWSFMRPEHIEPLTERVAEDFPPLVMMDRTVESLDCDYVASDNYGGAQMAVRHLLDLGHERIVFLGHDVTDLLPVAERLQGYEDAMRAAGLTPLAPWLIPSQKHELSPARTLKVIEDRESAELQFVMNRLREVCPTAIFALNDHIGLLASWAAAAVGLRVPQDLSIVGFDNSDLSRFRETPLTTVAQDIYGIGRRSVELLIERMEGYRGKRRWERIPVELRVRGTTGRRSD